MGSSPTEAGRGLACYLKEIRCCGLLSRELEQDLATRFRATGCNHSRNRLLTSNLRFVVKIANEYRNMGLPIEDLLCEGNLGLIDAVQRFDPSRGTKFTTYSAWWIRKAILLALGEQGGGVRKPRNHHRRVREIRETEETLRHTLGRGPRRDELSDRLSRSAASIDRTLLRDMKDLGLDDTTATGKPVSDFMPDLQAANPETELVQSDLQNFVHRAVKQLKTQERTVISLRFGIGVDRSHTLNEIGTAMGLSRERVRQIERRATQRLRRHYSRFIQVHGWRAVPRDPFAGQGMSAPA